MDRFSKIVIPEGHRLLEVSEFFEISNFHKEKFAFGKGTWDFDEVVAFPLINTERKYWNLFGWFARFGGDRSGVGGCGRYLTDVGEVRGVRFARDVKVKRKKK